MRRVGLLAATALLGLSTPVMAQVSVGIGIGLPSVRLGIHLGGYPELVGIPGYPVYYASGLDSNFFFYDGLYWVLSDDGWYSSSWYDGPWDFVDPAYVPLYILRVPVRYYRRPPVYFRGWDQAGPPRWGEHFGRDWEQRRTGWDRWNRSGVPARAPLPTYQRDYAGSRYPRADQQRDLQNRNYRYQPQEPVPPARSGPRAQQGQPQRAVPPRETPQLRPDPEQRSQVRPSPQTQPQTRPVQRPEQGPAQRQEQRPAQQSPQAGRDPRRQPDARATPESRPQPDARRQSEPRQQAAPAQRAEQRAPQPTRQAPQRPDNAGERKQDNVTDRKERDAPRDR